MWITANNVHVHADPSVVQRPPQRSVTWVGHDGCVGWLLPGADRGTGGGRQQPRASQVRCPVTFLWQPAGTVCQECDEVHDPS